MTELKYHCEYCGKEIDIETYNNNNGYCNECFEDLSTEIEDDFGVWGF